MGEAPPDAPVPGPDEFWDALRAAFPDRRTRRLRPPAGGERFHVIANPAVGVSLKLNEGRVDVRPMVPSTGLAAALGGLAWLLGRRRREALTRRVVDWIRGRNWPCARTD